MSVFVVHQPRYYFLKLKLQEIKKRETTLSYPPPPQKTSCHVHIDYEV